MRCRIAVAVGALALTSCTAPFHDRYSDISDVAESPSERLVDLAGRAGTASQRDREFVYRATVQCIHDVALARMADERARTSAIREYAHEVTGECRAWHRRLAVVAEQYVGVAPPDRIDRAHAAKIDEVAALSGRDFERAYVENQVEDSDRAIQLFLQQSYRGGEPMLASFAVAALPQLERRHRAALELRARLRE